MKIYTKTGDRGETGLFAGPRVLKNHPRIEAFGAVDELNAALGAARAESPPDEIDRLLARIQNDLFAVGAELATPQPAEKKTDFIRDEDVLALEAAIDHHEAVLSPLRQFILPGGTRAAAALHMARAIGRRAERRVVALSQASDVELSPRLVRYLNRLGDLLFVLSRAVNAAAGLSDTPWRKPGE